MGEKTGINKGIGLLTGQSASENEEKQELLEKPPAEQMQLSDKLKQKKNVFFF